MKIFLTIAICLALSAAAFAAGDLAISGTSSSVEGGAGQNVQGTFNVTASADLYNIDVSSTDLGSISSSAVSFSTDNFDLTNGSSQIVTYTIAVPSDANVGSYSGTITATANDSSSTDSFSVSLTVSSTGNLIIADLDVEVDGETDANIDNGDEIGEKAHPGSEIKMDFKIENNFSTDIEIDGIELEVEIDDLDIDENEDDIDDLEDSGDDDDVTIEFKIPGDADKDTYDVEITLEGRDENGNAQRVEWTIELEVDKEDDEVKIKNAFLTGSKVECDPRQTTLVVEVENTGEDDQKDAMIKLFSDELDIDTFFSGIIIDEGEEVEKRLPVLVDNNMTAGTYTISVKSFYDSDRTGYDDVRSVNLEVADCVTDTAGSSDQDSGSGATATATTTSGTSGSEDRTTPSESTTKSTSSSVGDVRESKSYFIVIVVLVVIASVVSIALLVRLMSRK